MRSILYILFALLIIACSDSQEQLVDDNQYLPIKNLDIPKHASQGDTISIKGEGFDVDTKLGILRNASVVEYECKIVSVDERSVNIVLPSTCESGFYIVVLHADNNTHRIGGINILGGLYEESDFELYVLKGAMMEIYPASMSKQLVALNPVPNSSMKDLDFSGFVVALSNGMVYHTSYGVYVVDGWIKEIHNLSAYNIQTNQKYSPIAIQNLFVIGEIQDEFYIIKTDANYKQYDLIKWSGTTEELVRSFDFSMYGGARILSVDQKFQYFEKEQVILFSGNMGKGDSMEQVAFVLDMVSGQVYKVGNSPNYRYAFASTYDKLFCFATELDDGDVVKTVVMQIDDVRNWSMSGLGARQVAQLDGVAFDMPQFSPVSGMIYGVHDAESFAAITTFNPITNSFESKRWIAPGVAGYFFADVKK